MNEHLFDLLDRLGGGKHTQGYLALPIPCPIDDEVRTFVDLLIRSDTAERSEATSLMTRRHASVLGCYAERNATRAVRERRPELISHALSALALASQLSDPRDLIVILSLLYRSGELIGLPAITSSTYRIEIDNPEFVDFWNQFRARTEVDRSIETMRYAEGSDQDGFRYKYTGPTYDFSEVQRTLERAKRSGGNVP